MRGLLWDELEGFSGLGSLWGMWGLPWVMVLSVPAFCGLLGVGQVTSIRFYFPPFFKIEGLRKQTHRQTHN